MEISFQDVDRMVVDLNARAAQHTSDAARLTEAAQKLKYLSEAAHQQQHQIENLTKQNEKLADDLAEAQEHGKAADEALAKETAVNEKHAADLKTCRDQLAAAEKKILDLQVTVRTQNGELDEA